MTTSIALTGAGTGLMSREDLVNSLNNSAMEMPSVSGIPFLKMDRGDGKFFYGQEETEVEEGSMWAANPLSLRKGYVCWDSNAGGKPVQEFMVPYSRPLPALSTLPELGMSAPHKKTGKVEQLTYQPQYSVELVCVSGEDVGVTVEYKQSSGGALKLFNKLTNAILDRAQKGEEIVPIGVLKNERYKNDTYGGYTYNPLFEIVEWRTIDDASVPGEEAEAPEAEKEPERATRKRAAPAATTEPEPTDEDEALAAEYAAEKEAQAPSAEASPRRRVRR